jgi:hypothetical protein
VDPSGLATGETSETRGLLPNESEPLQHPKRVPLSELCCEGSRPTYAKVLKRVPMAEGGRWVWQPDRTQAQMVPQKGHVQN